MYPRILRPGSGSPAASLDAELARAVLANLPFACLGAVVTSAAVMAALLAFNIFAATLDRSNVAAHVRAAFASDALGLAVHQRTNTREGAHQFNDCLILYMVLDTRGTAIQRGLSPLNAGAIEQDPATYNPCEQLQALAFGTARPPSEPTEFYQRYIHGQVALTSILLNLLPLPVLRALFDLFSFLGVAGLTLAGAWQIWFGSRTLISDATNPDARVRLVRGLVTGTIAAALLAFFGLQFYGMSLSHFPSDAVLIAYLWFACLFDLGRLNTIASVTLHSLFGVLTAYFELLTGGIPLGVCFIFLAFVPHATRNPVQALSRAVAGVAAFLIAVLTAFAIKLVLASIVFDAGVFADFFGQLGRRARDGSTNVLDLAIALFAASHYLGAGWRLLGASLLLASVLAFAAGLYRLSRAPVPFAPRAPVLLIAAAFLSIAGWYLVMLQHAHQHNFLMVRIAVGMIAPSALIFALGYRREIVTLLTGILKLAHDPLK